MTIGAGEPIIETTAYRKAYGHVIALEGLDLSIPRAAIGLLGANGAGKSTLIKGLLGLLQPTSGSAKVLGKTVADRAPEIRELVGYMPESETIPGAVSASDFVGHMAEMSGLPRRAARQRANDVLYQVGLNEERYRPIREFSTGMKQRVKLAQAIVHDPELVFLDEPTNGMDPQGREEMLALVNRIHRQLGITVILSSHILGDVERTCEYVVMLDHGRLVVAGNIASLRAGGGDIIVRVDGNMTGFMDCLSERGVTAETMANEIVVKANGDDEIYDAIRDAVVASGSTLRQLRSQQRSLEDVYIQTVSGLAEPAKVAEVEDGD